MKSCFDDFVFHVLQPVFVPVFASRLAVIYLVFGDNFTYPQRTLNLREFFGTFLYDSYDSTSFLGSSLTTTRMMIKL